jgi:hypothetical protein
MALGSTQSLIEMGKSGQCVGLTLSRSCADCLEIWEPQPPGTLRAQGLLCFSPTTQSILLPLPNLERV